MPQAKTDDRVKVHYIGRLEDGTQFDSSAGIEPLEFTIGGGEVLPGFERAVIGMQPGERKTVRIPAGEAYGEHHEQLVAELDRSDIPPHLHLEVGNQLEVTRPDGEKFSVLVTAVSAEKVSLDANHPLAGKELIFDIDLVEIL